MRKTIDRIFEEMRRKGWGQEKLAAEAKVSQSTINRVLNEGADPRIGTLLKIARALKIPVEYLTAEDDERANIIYEVSQMTGEEVRSTLQFIEKEKLYKSHKKPA